LVPFWYNFDDDDDDVDDDVDDVDDDYDDDDDNNDDGSMSCWYNSGTCLVPCWYHVCVYICTNKEPISGNNIKTTWKTKYFYA
jgi:hypothetical protein